MVTQMLSRSQRRMERRQAMLLLALVLAVSLVSFALGVMVGRGRVQEPTAAVAAVERRPVAVPGSAGPSAGGAAQDLTFYDALPKGGKPPLGSGINLAPAETSPKAAAAPAEPHVAAPAAPPSAAQPQTHPPVQPRVGAPQPSPAATALPRPAAAPSPVAKAAPEKAGGTWVIQAGSFRDAEDAAKMKQRLAGKGFPAFVQQAALGEKGTWHRVLVGPFDSESAASGMAGRLRSEEKLSVMVRKP